MNFNADLAEAVAYARAHAREDLADGQDPLEEANYIRYRGKSRPTQRRLIEWAIFYTECAAHHRAFLHFGEDLPQRKGRRPKSKRYPYFKRFGDWKP